MTERPENLGGELPAGLAKPAQRALAAAGIRSLDQLAEFSDAEIKQLHGMGPKALGQLRQAMTARGLHFAPSAPVKRTSR